MARNEIVIKTALHPGIAPQTSDPKISTYYTWSIGPRNLMRAIETLSEHSSSMTRGYGNVGHSGSWIEIAGVSMHVEDFHEYEFDTDPVNFHDLSTRASSKTEWCKRFIASVLDGSLVKTRKQNDEHFQAMRDAYYDAFNAGREEKPRPKYDDDMLDLESERGYRDGIEAESERREADEAEAQRERDEEERARREYAAAEQARQQARAERAERNKQRVIAEAIRLRSIDPAQPITDPVMAAVVKSIAVITFERGPIGLGAYKSRMLAGQYPDVVRQYVQSDWIFERIKNVVPREWEMGDDE